MSTPAPLPAFDRAVFSDRPNAPPPPDQCAYCGRGLDTEYFRVSGHLACANCAQRAQSLEQPDSHRAFVRAMVFGAGAALLACAGYSVVRMTGFMIGYVALGVGWLIGKAMKLGSGGLGGRRYQVAAVLLTYAAISLSFVPLAMKAAFQERAESKAAVSQTSPSAGDSSATAAEPEHAKTSSLGQFVFALLELCGLGLISPFLTFGYSVGHALFGLLFLYLGMQIAWKMLQKAAVEVDGPFPNVTPPNPS